MLDQEAWSQVTKSVSILIIAPTRRIVTANVRSDYLTNEAVCSPVAFSTNCDGHLLGPHVWLQCRAVSPIPVTSTIHLLQQKVISKCDPKEAENIT